MNIIQNKTLIALSFLSLCTMLTACSADDEQTMNTDGRSVRQLSIAEVPLTRATLTDNITTLGATWKADDPVTYLNLTSFTSFTMDYGTLTAASGNATSSFSGEVRCIAEDKVALLYPATTPITSGENRGKFAISLAHQTGLLADMAKDFHYVYGVAEVTSVTETTATATRAEMKPLLAACKFTFKDGSQNPIPVKTLSISYGEDLSAGFPQTYVLLPNADPAQVYVPDNLPPAGTPLSITFDTETIDGIYVALFPISGQTLFFSVTNSNGTYTGTSAATLRAGRFYPAALTLSQITQL